MSTPKCGDCGGDFTWDTELGSGVCPNCGTLQDPSQTVLSSHLERDGGLPDICQWISRTSSSSFRTPTTRRLLASQSKEAAVARNKNSMAKYIAVLATRAEHPGIATRTQALFDLAMAKGSFRWGRKAKLIAGACLVIALRESNKSRTLQDVAYLVDETPLALKRVLSVVLQLLEIKLTSDEPIRLLPLLLTYLAEILAEQPSPLPSNLKKTLLTLDMQSVFHSAVALGELTQHMESFPRLPTAPISCAVYMLALEGEAVTSLQNIGELAALLGARCGTNKDVIMRRYKDIYQQLETWTDDVPWLSHEVSSRKSASKAAKRKMVARTLKDVIQFQQKAQKNSLATSPPTEANTADNGDSRNTPELENRPNQLSEATIPDGNPRKRKSTGRRLDAVTRFLLRPESSVPSDLFAKRRKTTATSLDVISHVLASEITQCSQSPTRLQILTNSRREEDIADEELFASGELEELLRTDDEVALISDMFDWVPDSHGEAEPVSSNFERSGNVDGQSGSARINMDALARILREGDLDSDNADATFSQNGFEYFEFE